MTDDQHSELQRDRIKGVIGELRRAAIKARKEGRDHDSDVMDRAANHLEGPEWDGMS